MLDYKDHATVIELFTKARDVDRDNREMYREVQQFLHLPDGQWQPELKQAFEGSPRYTLDMCSNIVDDISGEIENAAFSIKCRPASGDASIEIAEIYDGMIRDIESQSAARRTYNRAGRRVVAGGFDAWRIVQAYSDIEGFEQELFIRPIQNAVDNVYFDHDSRDETHANARHGFVLKPLAKDVYDKKYPKGSGMSVGSNREEEVLPDKPHDVVIGEIVYEKFEDQRIVELSNGKVYVDDEKYQQIKDELAANGITEVRERTRQVRKFCSRLFDGGGWLSGPKETVFRGRLPIIPVYGNAEVVEDKLVWYGEIQKKMDAQRILNYTESKKVEDLMYAPRQRLLATRTHLSDADDAKDASTANTNKKVVQLYTPDPEAPPPSMFGGAQIAPGVSEVSNDMRGYLTPPDQRMAGQAMGLRSGVALEAEQNAQDTKNVKYFSALKTAIEETAKVLVDAIPKVYDTKRIVRTLGEDGKTELITLHDVVIDQQTQQIVEKYDISRGRYDVTCKVGPEFKNRQSEAVDALLKMAQIDPSIIELGKDQLLKNAALPGTDVIEERARAMMIQNNLIPQSQMTDEELAQVQQAQMMAAQNQQPDPNMLIAQAEMQKANNEQTELQIKLMEAQGKQQERQIKAAQALMELHKLQGQTNKDNASAMHSVAQMLKSLSEAGIASPGAATSAMSSIEEIASDLNAVDVGGPQI